MSRYTIIFTVFVLAACGGGDNYNIEKGQASLERALDANATWPYEVVGTLDIVEAGYADTDTDYVEWAVGFLLIDDDEFGIMIRLEEGVANRAGINIDSGKKVKVWLEAPAIEYGERTFAVSRIEKL